MGRAAGSEGADVAEHDEGKDGGRPEWGKRWKPGEPLPWAKFDWARWLANPALRRLTPDQRGRFMDVYANTHGTRTPGVMTEEDVRGWAGFTREEWRGQREAFAPVFNTTRRKGKWLLEDVIETWKASISVAKRTYKRARKGGETRARNAAERNGIGPTSSAQGSAPAQLRAQQRLDVRGLEQRQRPTVPEVRSAQPGSAGHSPVASDGTVAVSDLLGRALRAGYADGTDGTAPPSGGGA
jgi:hypothetical protein